MPAFDHYIHSFFVWYGKPVRRTWRHTQSYTDKGLIIHAPLVSIKRCSNSVFSMTRTVFWSRVCRSDQSKHEATDELLIGWHLTNEMPVKLHVFGEIRTFSLQKEKCTFGWSKNVLNRMEPTCTIVPTCFLLPRICPRANLRVLGIFGKLLVKLKQTLRSIFLFTT